MMRSPSSLSNIDDELQALFQEKQLVGELLAEEEKNSLDDWIDLGHNDDGRRYMLVKWRRLHRAFRLGHINIHADLLGTATLFIQSVSSPQPLSDQTIDIRTLQGRLGNPSVIDELLSDPNASAKSSSSNRMAVLVRCVDLINWKLLTTFEIMTAAVPPVSVVTLPIHEPLPKNRFSPEKVVRLVAESLQGPVNLSQENQQQCPSRTYSRRVSPFQYQNP